MIVDALAAKKNRPGRVGGTLAKDTLDFYAKKFGQVARVFGVDTPISLIDYDAVGRYITLRLSEPGARNGTTVKNHSVSKELEVLRFGLHVQAKLGRYAHNVDFVTRKGEFAKAYTPERDHLTWSQIPQLLSALLLGSAQAVTSETITKARALKAAGKTLAQIGEALGVAPTTAHRTLNMTPAQPSPAAINQTQMAAWYIATAGRLSEIEQATMADHVRTVVRDEAGNEIVQWRVFMRGTKSKKARGWIPIHSEFHRYLEFALAGRPKTGPIFAKWQNADRALYAACRRAGIKEMSANDLRRTHASLLSQAGMNNSMLKEITRHETTRMLDEVYAVGNIDAVERALRNALPGKGDSE